MSYLDMSIYRDRQGRLCCVATTASGRTAPVALDYYGLVSAETLARMLRSELPRDPEDAAMPRDELASECACLVERLKSGAKR